ncbi:FHA domain-containing protein [Gilvimarinus polysaccharolyticus]|uniref:FHA domain-containing protein n=1 Tax=Gilvimarinus polysaccharolyticus TaxID=863921 RepID=UPI0006735F3D|nr:FHA domain-containing protein [Gilvimarinus polysaccharolyticus]
MLKLQRKDKPQEPILVVEKLYSIGSANDNNLVLDEPGIDSIHARLVASDGRVTLKDNTSARGCFVNGQRVTQKMLQAGDVLRLANIEFDVYDFIADPQTSEHNTGCWQLIADGSWLTGQVFTVPPNKRCVLGRSSDCDITIAGTHLSRRHTELTVMGSSLRVHDLNSANGTYLNDELVEDSLAHNGDRLRIDVYTFRVVSPDNDLNRTRVRIPTSQITQPAERKDYSNTPRRWITKPTSPGNRDEPKPASAGSWVLWLGIGVVLTVLATVAGFIYLG